MKLIKTRTTNDNYDHLIYIDNRPLHLLNRLRLQTKKEEDNNNNDSKDPVYFDKQPLHSPDRLRR